VDKELILDGKTYISARRVSEITGYNSDYLGQLCRAGKLDCRLVSRTWYVTEESLKLHHLLNGRKKIKEEAISLEVSDFSQNQKELLSTFNKEIVSKEVKSKNISVGSIIDSKKNSLNFLFAFVVSVSAILIILDVSNLFVKRDTAFYSQIEEVAVNVREAVGPARTIESSGTNIFSAVGRNIADRFSALRESITTAFSNFLRKEDYLAREKFEEGNKFIPKFEPGDDRGAVMVPMQAEADISDLSKIREYLRDSFSDDVEIIPDKSGVSGVIKPVFQEPSENEYFYVMVPVD